MVEVWYSEAINKIRFTAEPGGEALTVEQAEQRVQELQAAIKTAKDA